MRAQSKGPRESRDTEARALQSRGGGQQGAAEGEG